MRWGDWSREGWTVVGELALPETDPEDDDFADLGEDVWMANGPAGYIVHVGWYPESNPSGTWWCRVVPPANAWDNPSEEARPSSTAAMREWIDAACARAEAATGRT